MSETPYRASLDLLVPVADYFKVLSEVSRLAILDILQKSGAMNVTEIAQATGLGQANLSKHLKILTQAGFLLRQQSGVSVYYELADPAISELFRIASDRVKERCLKQAQQFEKL
jgi:DNA-binding transcriptional ArsR family regulator